MKFKNLILETLKDIPETEFNRLMYTLDLRTWYKVKINGEMMEWWACDNEVEDIRGRHSHETIEFIEIPLKETIIHK